MQAKPPSQNLHELQQKVEFAEHIKRITSQIHAAKEAMPRTILRRRMTAPIVSTGSAGRSRSSARCD